MAERYGDGGKALATLGGRRGRNMAEFPFRQYHNGEYREEEIDFEPCLPIHHDVRIDGIEGRRLPGSQCVSFVHRGPEEESRRSYATLLHYVKVRCYEITSPPREVYPKGPGLILRGDPKKHLTEVQRPVDIK